MGNIAIIGFGRAGYSCADTLRKNGYSGSICIFTDYETGVENPMLATYYASEKIGRKEMMPFGELASIGKDLDLDIRQGVRVKQVCPESKTIIYPNEKGEDTEELFDDILIATGSAPILPPFQAAASKDVITIRNIGDAERMNYALYHASKALVVGCSMIGIKVVQALTEHDARITFIDMADKVFPTAVLPGMEEILADRIREKGIDLKLATGISEITEINGDHPLEAVFADGTKETFDVVFLCMGTRACVDVVKDSVVETGRAIKVDLHMKTNIDHIYAAGDCCETYELSTGTSMNVALWANAAEQGEIAARNILGRDAVYEGNLICNLTHFWDTTFVSIGNNRADGELIRCSGNLENTGKKWQFAALIKDEKLVCVNIIDNPGLSGIFKDLMRKAFLGEEEGKQLVKYSFGRFYLPREIAKLVDQYLK